MSNYYKRESLQEKISTLFTKKNIIVSVRDEHDMCCSQSKSVSLYWRVLAFLTALNIVLFCFVPRVSPKHELLVSKKVEEVVLSQKQEGKSDV